MWTIEQVLSEHPHCPVCESRNRSRSTCESEGSNFYLDALFKSAGIDIDDALEKLILWECKDCMTLWYDPWLKMDFVASGYGYLAGRHKFGWAALRAWVEDLQRPYAFSRRRILDLLLALLPEFSIYAEVNCPFSGLFFELHNRRSPEFDKQTVVRKLQLLSGMYASPSIDADYAPTDAWRALPRPCPTGVLTGLERVLIEAPSPMCWGRSCNLAGANCHALARDLIVERVIDFETASREGRRFDAIGLFHTLDHFPDPMAVIDKALSLAEIVLLDMHAWGWTAPQHFYNLGHGIGDILSARGISVVDISAHVTARRIHGDSDRYLMLSRARDLPLDIRQVAKRDSASDRPAND